MQPAKIGMQGQAPEVAIKSPNADIELARWHEKMATYVPESQKRKYLKTAEKLRELAHLRKYARHFASCRQSDYVPECTCGMEQ